MSKCGVQEVIHEPHVWMLATRYMLLSFPIKHISVLRKNVQKEWRNTLKGTELRSPYVAFLPERQGISFTLRVGYVAQGHWLMKPQ